ncbi:MAG: uracil-DNA glycosylase [Nannocystaceae bacterium]
MRDETRQGSRRVRGQQGDGAAAKAARLLAYLQHLRDHKHVRYLPLRPEPRARASPSCQNPPQSAGPPTRGDTRRPQQVSPLRSEAAAWPPARKLQYLQTKSVGDCQRCPLGGARRNIVFGAGSPTASLMFVGEAPGLEEDEQGEPFVGAAGRRLTRWITALGLKREDVYIANVLKCRPPGNRDPSSLEVTRCSPFLRAQIRVIQPKVLVGLGRFAGCLLLGREQRLYEMRAKVHEYVELPAALHVPLIITYHPSYVLRRESEVGGAAQDSRADQPSPDQAVLSDLHRAVSLLGADARV